ncbi:hypothetical protein Hanom_Chr11g01058121 [Helianthus anomalus]
MSMPLASHDFSLPSFIAKSSDRICKLGNMALIINRYKDKLATLRKDECCTSEII